MHYTTASGSLVNHYWSEVLINYNSMWIWHSNRSTCYIHTYASSQGLTIEHDAYWSSISSWFRLVKVSDIEKVSLGVC